MKINVYGKVDKVELKPHIYLLHDPVSGKSFWRVSPMPRAFGKLNPFAQERWKKAYDFTAKKHKATILQ